MNGQEPSITRTDPRAYYLWLQTQRIPPYQAAMMVQQRFPVQSPEERARQQANQAQSNALAQTGGTIGGILVTQEALRNFPNVREWTGFGQQPTFDSSGSIGITRSVPGQTLDLDALAASQTPGAIGGTAQAPVTPKVVSVKGTTATVEMPTGGTQQVPAEALNDPGFWSSVNWGQVAQGGLALAQLYGAYRAYQSGDKLGAGIYGAAGAGSLAASGALGAQAAGAASGAAGGYLIPGLNILAGAYGGYQTAEQLSDMAAGSKRTQTGVLGGATSGAALGAGIGSIVPGAGTAIGAAIGAVVGGLAGAVGSWTGSSKGKAQMMRDQIRGVLQEGGILNQDFKGTLANGTQYDFGKDGSTLKWKNIDKIAEKQPSAWNAAVPLTDALATAYGFVGQKASDISAWYAKGAVSNAGDDPNIAIANARHFAQQQNITYDQIKAKLDEAIRDERINQSQYDYYLGGARQLTAGIKPQQGPQVRPPAPNAPQVQIPPQAKPAKQSIRDVLKTNIKTQG